MSSIDKVAEAIAGIRQSLESNRLAHAYVVTGAVKGDAMAFAESFLQLLFCTAREKPCGLCAACTQVKKHEHADILWLRPESKSRKIDIEQIREELNPRIHQTAYQGGWKAGVLLHADRLTEQAANAFLKTLEEPPGSSLLLLLTDAPQYLMPTILSRCQRIALSAGQDVEGGPWRDEVMGILREGAPADVLEATLQSARFKAILDEIKKTVEADEPDDDTGPQGSAKDDGNESSDEREARIAARVIEERQRILRIMLLWQRDVLLTSLNAGEGALHFDEEADVIRRQAEGLSYIEAQRRLQAVETVARRLERSLPPESVFEAGLLSHAAPVRPSAPPVS